MSAFTGTSALVRLVLRRERVALPVWTLLLPLYVVGTAAGLGGLYSTPEARAAFATATNQTPAEVALIGPVLGASLGGLTAWRVGVAAPALTGLMALLTVVRHTRAEEEDGRRELLGAAPMGRLAPLAAALLVVLGAGVLIGGLTALGLLALGLPGRGAAVLGLGLAGFGWVMAGVAGLAAQLAAGARGASALAGLALGLAYLLRAAGDATGTAWLTALSPFGWLQRARPFAGESPWVLALFVGATALLAALAFGVQARRDLGAALLRPRPGPATAAPGLNGPLALAWRQQRGPLLTWTLGYAAVGALLGGLATAAGAQLQASPQLRALASGTGLFTVALGLFGGELLAVQVLLGALRPRAEELAGRAEPLLAAPLGRTGWLCSHLLFALLGPALALGAFGLAGGAAYTLSGGPDLTGRLLLAALAALPAVWVLAGVAAALFGLWPRLAALGWGVLAACLALDLLAELKVGPQALWSLSPFAQVPRRLLGQDSWSGPLWLTLLAAALLVAGLLGFRRRDVS